MQAKGGETGRKGRAKMVRKEVSSIALCTVQKRRRAEPVEGESAI